MSGLPRIHFTLTARRISKLKIPLPLWGVWTKLCFDLSERLSVRPFFSTSQRVKCNAIRIRNETHLLLSKRAVHGVCRSWTVLGHDLQPGGSAKGGIELVRRMFTFHGSGACPVVPGSALSSGSSGIVGLHMVLRQHGLSTPGPRASESSDDALLPFPP